MDLFNSPNGWSSYSPLGITLWYSNIADWNIPIVNGKYCTYSIRVHFPACYVSFNASFGIHKIIHFVGQKYSPDFGGEKMVICQSHGIELVDDHLKQKFRKTAVRTNIGRRKTWAMTRIDCFNETFIMEGCLMLYQLRVFDVSHPKNWGNMTDFHVGSKSSPRGTTRAITNVKNTRFLQLNTITQTTFDGRNLHHLGWC